MQGQIPRNIYQDIGIIALSVLVAVLLGKSGALETFLVTVGEWRLVGSFLAGMLFTSVFTAAPAAVLLGELAQANSVWDVAAVGAFGALAGDYLIFRFVRDRLSEDIRSLLGHKVRRLPKIWKLPSARWLTIILGMIIIASPLPDEIGIALLGFMKTRKKDFFLLSLVANFLGILAIGLVAREW